MTLRCAADRACACAVLRMRAVRSAFFVVGRLFGCTRDALRQTCFTLRLFSLLLRNALMQYEGGMRYGARFTPLVNGVVLQKGECKKAGIWRVSFRCRCAEHWVAVRVLCAAKDAEHLFLFDRTEHFPPRTHRAHCAATAEREAQWNKSAAVHLCTLKQTTHSRKTRSVPHISSALHQRKCGRQRTMCHLCTNLHA